MTRSLRDRIQSVPHEVNRLAIAVGEPLDAFRARYERAVPVYDAERFAGLVAAGATWDTLLEATRENAPHGFIIYWSHDFSPLMRLAGHRLRGIEYLMGNHAVAETMYRHDPAIMLYAPLRTVIYEDAGGETWFAIDQPRTRFGSFGDPGIARGGVELDRRLAALLAHLGLPAPDVLTART
ncbi:DUF302 domain-containing protein [Nonomuraea jiangxiensis]|uniref:DUF302 domain-containing protein n=1 Tax=Nonomuraea jiangxiensis TaxID=633440 RepID=A0A1G9VZ03_9ACTN|nr:DUF302 domain-containing protein [Nonomuraea jiangxiensis]SDM77470.1 protein of unknown function DUF302 [Nonomuraea jiangxiensis]